MRTNVYISKIGRFPGRVHPTEKTILRVVQQLCETGCLVHNNRVIQAVRHRRVRDEERVLDAFYENPGTNIRNAAREFGFSKYNVHRTLRENQLYPYHSVFNNCCRGIYNNG